MAAESSALTIPSSRGSPDTEKQAPTVLLICVKYGADEETERYLESLHALHGQPGLRVLVVDNTTEPSSERYSGAGNFTTIQAPGNLGYFGGARYGLSVYLEQNSLPDWIIVSNVDLAIPDYEFLNRLSQLASIPNLGAVAPSIRSALTGMDQNPYLTVRPSAMRMHAYKWLCRNWLVFNTYDMAAALFNRLRNAVGQRQGAPLAPNQRNVIYAPHGSS